jgi:hypothetical protein
VPGTPYLRAIGEEQILAHNLSVRPKDLSANAWTGRNVAETAMTDRPNKKKFEPSRAARFPIRTSISYRPEGIENWKIGETENISRSGVLFNSHELLEVNTALEMTFPLPTEIKSDATTGRTEGGAIVLCRGRIVRTVLPPASDSPGRMAATFSDYLMERNGAAGEPENTD